MIQSHRYIRFKVCYFLQFCASFFSFKLDSMASQREYLLIGDSNVRRFHSRVGLQQAQNLEFVQARNLAELTSALTSVTNAFKFVVLSVLTNLIIDAGSDCVSDVDRLSAIEDMFISVIQMIRLALFFFLFLFGL